MSVQTGTKRKEGGFAETVRVVIHALIIALVIRTFLFQPFNIPSGSMIPTLLVGDYLFVSKYSYGYTSYSFPTSFCVPFSGFCTPEIPLFSGRIFASQPQRGDVVVFRLPKDDSIDYIKRLIGLPGDHIQMIDGVLNINGVPVKRERIDDYVTDDDGVVQRVKRYHETLPNGVSYTTIDLTDNGFYDNTPVYTVPPDSYFMMGDNRDNSQDSRVLGAVGYVPFANLIGRAQMIFFSMEDGAPAWELRAGAAAGAVVGAGAGAVVGAGGGAGVGAVAGAVAGAVVAEVWRWPWTVRWGRLFTLVR
jgi:signal peptidase I